jgi:hypothetical protein
MISESRIDTMNAGQRAADVSSADDSLCRQDAGSTLPGFW